MLLSASGVKHEIGGRPVLDGVTFDLAAGRHALLLGPSGSGKTTLINILAGLITPTYGIVKIEDRPFSALGAAARDALRRQSIGLVFQTLRLISAITVRQNLSLAQRVALGRTDNVMIDGLIHQVGLSHRADAKPRELSQGEGQRAAIARALCTQPKILIADEPTSALDNANAERMVDLLLDSATRTGATLLIATHDERIIRHFADVVSLSAPDLRIAA